MGAANLAGIVLGFMTPIAFTSLPELITRDSPTMRKFTVKNEVCDRSIFFPVLGAGSCERDVAPG